MKLILLQPPDLPVATTQVTKTLGTAENAEGGKKCTLEGHCASGRQKEIYFPLSSALFLFGAC